MTNFGLRRALVLANVFYLLVAIYFLIISIISLVKLRWFHQLTMVAKVRRVFTTATSYSAFLALILTAILLIVIIVLDFISLSSKTYISTLPDQAATGVSQTGTNLPAHQIASNNQSISTETRRNGTPVPETRPSSVLMKDINTERPLLIKDSIKSKVITTNTRASCSILLHLLTSITLVIITVIWLLNSGELVRDSISTQLDSAFVKYQFANRSNHYSVAIDGMQDVNNCCGSLDYTDFPQRRSTGLSSGHYPGSCCGKNIFGVNARVLCTPEEIVRAKQTSGCVTVLGSYYDLMSILIVPVALACLFVDITIIALIALSRGHQLVQETRNPVASRAQRFELKTAA